MYRLGTEHEKFAYRSNDFSPATYEGPEPGIRMLLEGMSRFGWKRIDEDGLLIGLYRGNCTVTLEPGGQIELSGAPLRDVHQVSEEICQYHKELNTLAGELDLKLLALGHQPKHSRTELPWMPKERYNSS